MLKLILGGSGSGKTTLLYQRIGARAAAGEKSILLVPEQFTSSKAPGVPAGSCTRWPRTAGPRAASSASWR